METFSRSEEKKEKEQTLNLITHVEVQTACESDAHALVPAIVDTQLRGLGPGRLQIGRMTFCMAVKTMSNRKTGE